MRGSLYRAVGVGQAVPVELAKGKVLPKQGLENYEGAHWLLLNMISRFDLLLYLVCEELGLQFVAFLYASAAAAKVLD